MDFLWLLLLFIKEKSKAFENEIVTIKFHFDVNNTVIEFNNVDFNFSGDALEFTGHYLGFNRTGHFGFDLVENNLPDKEAIDFLGLYLPYALIGNLSRTNNKCFAITHFAQSLDGRISSLPGESKWIGNHENLIHAHRMRALCDAILVGRGTYVTDNPKLTVRFVPGDNPIKIIIGELPEECIKKIKGQTVFVSQNHKSLVPMNDKIQLKKVSGEYNPVEILERMNERGIGSVYIEGGAFTTSCFLKYGAIDHLQIHISSKILGKGKPGFDINVSNDKHKAYQFENFKYVKIGDEMMFIGEPC